MFVFIRTDEQEKRELEHLAALPFWQINLKAQTIKPKLKMIVKVPLQIKIKCISVTIPIRHLKIKLMPISEDYRCRTKIIAVIKVNRKKKWLFVLFDSKMDQSIDYHK